MTSLRGRGLLCEQPEGAGVLCGTNLRGRDPVPHAYGTLVCWTVGVLCTNGHDKMVLEVKGWISVLGQTEFLDTTITMASPLTNCRNICTVVCVCVCVCAHCEPDVSAVPVLLSTW